MRTVVEELTMAMFEALMNSDRALYVRARSRLFWVVMKGMQRNEKCDENESGS